jgi:hypothetical protein
MIADYLPGAAGASSPPADLAEVVCADLDLLTVEFDELVAANYPGLADRPAPRPPRRTARLLTRRLPPTQPSLPIRGDHHRSSASRRTRNAPRPGSAGRPWPCRPADRALRR